MKLLILIVTLLLILALFISYFPKSPNVSNNISYTINNRDEISERKIIFAVQAVKIELYRTIPITNSILFYHDFTITYDTITPDVENLNVICTYEIMNEYHNKILMREIYVVTFFNNVVKTVMLFKTYHLMMERVKYEN